MQVSRILWLSLAGWLILATGSTAQGADKLGPEIGKLAKTVSKFLEGKSEATIAVGQFTGPAGFETNYGPGIEERLKRELTALGINPARLPKFAIKGEYLSAVDPKQPEKTQLKLIGRIYDAKFGEVVLEASVLISDNAELSKALGLTVSLPPRGDIKRRNDEVQKRIKEPQCHLAGTQIATSANSPFAIELFVKKKVQDEGVARAATLRDGEPFVDIRRDEIYEIVIHNRTKLEAAVTVSIDGLDMYHFTDDRDPKTGRPSYSHSIIAPSSSATIVGWHKTNQKSLSFLVTEYGKGAASQARTAAGKTGVITVTFAYAWTGKKPVEEEGSRDGGNETGFGPPVKTDLKAVQREIGVVRDVISVRYTR